MYIAVFVQLNDRGIRISKTSFRILGRSELKIMSSLERSLCFLANSLRDISPVLSFYDLEQTLNTVQLEKW